MQISLEVRQCFVQSIITSLVPVLQNLISTQFTIINVSNFLQQPLATKKKANSDYHPKIVQGLVRKII